MSRFVFPALTPAARAVLRKYGVTLTRDDHTNEVVSVDTLGVADARELVQEMRTLGYEADYATDNDQPHRAWLYVSCEISRV